MKKNYLNFKKASLALSFMALFGATGVKAQVLVAGSATGTTPVNYTSLSSAFAAINAGTHSGAITVSITANVTEPTPPTALMASGGTSTYTSVYIRPAGGNFTVSSAATPTANRGIIELTGADNVTIDGDDPATTGLQNLSIISTVTTTPGIANIRLASNSATGADGTNNVTVKNCIIKGSRDAATSVVVSYGIQFFDASAGAASTSTMGANSSSSVTIQGNTITRCAYGVHAIGNSTAYLNSGLSVTSNTIGSSTPTDNVSYRGIDVSYTGINAASNTAVINQNDIIFGNTAATVPLMGIEAGNANAGIRIARNSVHDSYASPFGAYGIGLTGSLNSSDGIIVRNNFIRDIMGLSTANTATAQAAGLGGVGIMVTNTVTGMIINNNTIAQLAAGALGSCVQLNNSGATISSFRNNALVNNVASSVAACFYCTSTLSIAGGTLNNNDYYANATAKTAFYNNAYLATLANFTAATAMDANSYSVMPNFVSSTNLHIVAGQPSMLESTGASTAVTGVAIDYDGDSRPGPAGSIYGGAQAPDIGADEFDGLLGSCVTPTITAAVSPTGAVCSGASVTLTAGGATTYTWSAGTTTNVVGTGSAVVVNPTVNTVYTVLGTTNTCVGMNTIAVTVNGTVTASSSASAVCAGNLVSITGSGATSYTITSPTGTIANGASFSPTTTATYTIAGLNACGTTTTSLSIAVNAVPSLTVTNAPTGTNCAGTSVTLTASGPSTTYTWTTGTATNVIGTSSVVVVTPTTVTTYSVAGTSPGCSPSTKTITVQTDNTVTAVSSATAVCLGNSVSITGGGSTTGYTITSPTGTVANATAFSPTTTATYTVSTVNACGSSSVTLNVFVSAVPSLTVAPTPTGNICSGTSVTLTANGPSTTYTWTTGTSTNVIGSSSVVVVTPTALTVYTVAGTNPGCAASIKTISIQADNTVAAVSSASAICFGNTVSVSGSGATSYTVTAPTGTVINGGTLSPTVTTTYTVAGVNACGTTSTTVTVAVNAVPSLTTAATPTGVVCSGTSVTLTANGPSTTYTWTTGTSTNVIGSSSVVVVTPTATSNYTVAGTNPGCSASVKTISIVVDRTVSATSSSSVICSGNAVTITASGSTTGYTITSPTGTIANNVSFSPTTTATYTISTNNACGSSSTAVTITVNAVPSLTVVSNPSVNICNGSSATLTANGPSSTYTWTAGGSTNVIGSSSVVVVSPTINTTYTVSGTNPGCSASTKTISVLVDNTPTLNVVTSATAVCFNRSVSITATGANTYTITSPTGTVGNGVAFTPTGTASYTVNAANACGTPSTVVSITVNPLPTLTVSPSTSSLCSGASVVLSVNGTGTSYTWAVNGSTNTAITITPAISTGTSIVINYTATASSAAGCTATAVAPVTVVATPVISPIASPPGICVGGTVALILSGSTNYTWTSASGNFANTASVVVTPTLVPTSPTPITYSVTSSNANCVSTKTVNVIMNPLPSLSSFFTSPGPSSTSVCAGTTASITAGGALTYTWTGPTGTFATGSNATVNPTITTTYTFAGNNGTCATTSTITIPVNPIPTLGIVSSPTALCTGSIANLTASGGINYTWTASSTTNVLFGTSVNVNPTVTTAYTLIGDNSYSCTSTAGYVLFVNSLPTIAVTPASTLVCLGRTVTLNASSNNAQAFQWVGGPVTNAYAVSPSVTTVYTITAGNLTTQCIAFRTATVSVFNPSFTAPSPTTICKGIPIIISATGAASYTWQPGNLNGPNVSLNPSVTTVYTVAGTGTVVNGNNVLSCQASYTTSITVNPNPTVTAAASKTLICRQETSTLTATGANTYVWHPTPASGTGSVVVVNSTDFPNYINSVTYTVTGTDTHNCKDTHTITVITSGCVGIDEQSTLSNNVSVYPNPNNGEFTVHSEQNITLHLMNEVGQHIRTITLNETSGRDIKLTDLANGIYFLVGSNINGKVSQKIVITK